jgi:hypothetical protein
MPSRGTVLAVAILLVVVSASYLTVSRLQNQISEDQQQISELQTGSEHPTLLMWSSNETLHSGGWLEEAVPDAFDFYVSFNSTVPVTVYFLSVDQYVQFANSGGSISTVKGQYIHFPATTSLKKSIFTLAEGCGGYISVFQSSASGVIYPNIVVTYNPALSITGVCASNS